jgi:hypothetical protein
MDSFLHEFLDHLVHLGWILHIRARHGEEEVITGLSESEEDLKDVCIVVHD